MTVDARGPNFAANTLNVERAIYQFDLVKVNRAGDGQGVFHAGGIVTVLIVEGEVVVTIFSADGDVIFAGVHFNFCAVETLLRPSTLDGVHFDFVAVPGSDVHRTVNVVEGDAAIRRNRVSLMKLLGKRTRGSPI